MSIQQQSKKGEKMDKAIDLVSVEELSVEDLPQAVAPGASSAGTVGCVSSAGSCAGTLSSVSSYSNH
ncbi:thiocillin family RiPP [Curtobacterium sp. NPDC087080]|uniref:thiocillin family RiPP n=1 Tax=Curtobacterium sp. NPDC087080 TaxID=3363965 RepID=UPI00382D73FC